MNQVKMLLFLPFAFFATTGWTSRAPSPDESTSQPAQLTPLEVLSRALDDERRAAAIYGAILAKFGERRPFSNIIHAERRHAAALLAEFERLNLTPPPDRWAAKMIAVPDAFAAACDAAEHAETQNIRMYDELLRATTDPQTRQVLENLQAASRDRHLPAFRRHSNAWRRVQPADAGADVQAQVKVARSARDELFTSLFARLSEELGRGGTAAAIRVCQQAAPELAARVGRAHGVKIGRTAPRLRNPDNVGPPWVAWVLDAPEPVAEERFLQSRDGRLGVILPIRMAESCRMCHGPAAALSPEVRAQLNTHYPEDQATGFEVGDIRGWFWVEVPRARE